MTPTPRTDAMERIIVDKDGVSHAVVYLADARTLETELSQSNKDIGALQDTVARITGSVTRQRLRAEAWKSDAVRMANAFDYITPLADPYEEQLVSAALAAHEKLMEGEK